MQMRRSGTRNSRFQATWDLRDHSRTAKAVIAHRTPKTFAPDYQTIPVTLSQFSFLAG